MRTTNYIDVYRGALALCGIPVAEVQNTDFRRFREWFDKRLTVAWQANFWPELMRMQQRFFKADYAGGTAYTNDGTIVYFPQTQKYYLALRAARLSVSSITRSGTTATVTTSAAHNLATGNQVTISGAAQTDYNITATITVTGSATFTYTVANAPATPATGTLLCGVNPTDVNGLLTQAYWAQALMEYQADNYLPTATYTVGTAVYYPPTDTYYQAHTTAPTGTLPTSTTYFGTLYTLDQVIGLSQTGETVIGECIQAWNLNPYRRADARDLSYILSNNGIQFYENVPYVWLWFRVRPPVVNGDVFDSTLTYAVGEQVYFSVDGDPNYPGNFYDCVTATSAGESPSSAAAKWSVVEIPFIFKRYLSQAMYAEWLADGQNEKYILEEQKADALLSQEAALLSGQQQQLPTLSVRTR